MSSRQTYRLKVQQVGQACVFDLSWGKGQQLSAQVNYPESLERAYENWFRCYLLFYKNLSPDAGADLRGELKATGRITLVGVDWQAELVQAEAELLQQLHHWLRSAELYEIRAAIRQPADLLLVCEPLALARLPWEKWDLDNVRIARCPANIRAASNRSPQQRRRVRVLAILGDEKGLDFAADRAAVQALAPQAKVQFVGWQPELSIPELKKKICDAISHPLGWDILFFAGHSNETNLTGGELAIAPNTTITIQEIAPYLKQLQERGLQLAIFNSCSGLSIAMALVDLGLSQVVVMREPVHNRVAQVFLGRFLQQLGEYQDAHSALSSAIAHLQAENLNFPSAHLVPSFFRHPEADLFQLQPPGLRHRARLLVPSRLEAVSLVVLVLLSLWPTLQDGLLDQRIGVQSVYRMLTDQVPEPTPPLVTLIQIDETSLQKAGIQNPNPMDRAYLAQLVDALAAKEVQMIGFDYLLDRPQPQSDQRLARAIQAAVENQNTWFIFAALQQGDESDGGVGPTIEIASPNWSLQGDIHGWPTHITLPATGSDCQQSCPLAYLMALATEYQEQNNNPIQPSLENETEFRATFLAEAQRWSQADRKAAWIQGQQKHWLAEEAIYLGQKWLLPIVDFSIPPEQVYQRVAAWQLLADEVELSSPVTLIVSGGYPEAGITPESDNFSLPLALKLWQASLLDPEQSQTNSVYTGGEAHAYMIHHFLKQRMVVPIPNLWLVLLAFLLGKIIVLTWEVSPSQVKWRAVLGGVGATGLYGLVGQQVYLSAAIVLPWLLPSITVWVYILPVMWKAKS